jgi:hypothetical protein
MFARLYEERGITSTEEFGSVKFGKQFLELCSEALLYWVVYKIEDKIIDKSVKPEI